VTNQQAEADIDFSSLPQVDQTARPPVQRRPRFDGDVSELPDRACWALQHLLTRRYISAEADADVYSWVLEYRNQMSVRLSELDLLLRIVDGTDVALSASLAEVSATTRRSGITGIGMSGTDTRRCRYTRLRFATWAACWL
jgi:hypothetical protein